MYVLRTYNVCTTYQNTFNDLKPQGDTIPDNDASTLFQCAGLISSAILSTYLPTHTTNEN